MSGLARLDHHIDGQRPPGEWLVAKLGARQHGVVARRQLAALGIGKGAIDGRVATGRLHPRLGSSARSSRRKGWTGSISRCRYPEVVYGGLPFHAEIVDDEAERRRLWDLADRVFPPFADYRQWTAKAGPTIPIVRLVPRQLLSRAE
jgi:hypothetical protein